ncbi:MAG: proline dehydrogenase family protein, partial [Pirellulaceae bacterium]|nr:proline dehydrogenase family protein [Pirellulaceae bacterium]
RFVDVLPMLGSSDAVVGHLNEFLSDVRDQLPRPLGAALGIARRTSLTRGAVARAAKLSAMDMARRFIAGTNTDEVVAAAQRERKLNRGFTLDILGEAVISHVEADRFCGAYVELIETIAPQVNRWAENAHIDQGVLGPLPRMNLSIKLSALDCKFDAVDPEGTLERVGAKLRRLLRIARNHQAFVNVDMESYDKKDLTLLIFKQILDEDEFCDVGDIGIVVQCYLRDAGRDLIDLADWARQRGKPVWVRLVKGAYWDYETIHAGAQRWPIPVYQQKWQSDACFERATRFVMQNVDHLRPALGTHNIRSMAHGIAVAEQLGLPQNAFEFQMLYGMADAEKRVLAELGHRLRVYMPYGELIPGMAYLVRRLLENTSNDSFLRAGFADNAATEELLTNPLTVGADSTRSPKEDTPEEELPKEYMPENDMTDQDISAKGSTTPLAATFANEPLVDFACPENRTSMRQALDQVKAQLGQTVPLLIGGESIETDEILESLDP